MRTVMITGAGRGLGLEFVRQYLQQDYRILACVRTPGRAQQLSDLARAAGKISIHTLDVADHAAIDALANRLTDTPIDIVLNVAGVLVSGGFGKTDFQAWLHSVRVNVFGPMKMAEAFVEHVAASHQKKIVTLSSTLGSIGGNGTGGMYDYRSTKAAVNAIMKSMSIDLAARGIIAVPLHPGWVRTDMGGPRAEIEVATSVAGMVRVIAGLSTADSGKFLNYQGAQLPW